jgi:LmbE family N-acetylglucosaminyl deacetylase
MGSLFTSNLVGPEAGGQIPHQDPNGKRPVARSLLSPPEGAVLGGLFGPAPGFLEGSGSILRWRFRTGHQSLPGDAPGCPGDGLLLPAVGAQDDLRGVRASTKIDRQPKTLLAVFAHPDDEAFVGPLLSHYARQGVRIRLAIVTEGAKVGSPRLGIPAGPEMARVRAQEARCSCRALGVEAPILLGFEDGGLGKPSHPPDGYLAQVVRRIRELFAQVRPDAVITWGPDGGYGHPDHRLVGAVVTQVVQAGADGAPSRLFYPGLPADPARPRIKDPRWALTDPRFLTVRIPYDAVDFESTRRAFACHQSQFSPEQLEGLLSRLQKRLRGRVYLRPWFGGGASDDVFSLEIP